MRLSPWGAVVANKVDHESIRAFVDNDGDKFAELADLHLWWDSLPPDAGDAKFPNYTSRHFLILSYSNWSFSKRWAWDGMQQLLAVLLERREPIPEELQYWAYGVVLGTRPRPRKAKNAERNAKMMHIVRTLQEDMGLSKEEAIAEIATALGGKPEGTVRSAVDAVRDARPFEKST